MESQTWFLSSDEEWFAALVIVLHTLIVSLSNPAYCLFICLRLLVSHPDLQTEKWDNYANILVPMKGVLGQAQAFFPALLMY